MGRWVVMSMERRVWGGRGGGGCLGRRLSNIGTRVVYRHGEFLRYLLYRREIPRTSISNVPTVLTPKVLNFIQQLDPLPQVDFKS